MSVCGGGSFDVDHFLAKNGEISTLSLCAFISSCNKRVSGVHILGSAGSSSYQHVGPVNLWPDSLLGVY